MAMGYCLYDMRAADEDADNHLKSALDTFWQLFVPNGTHYRSRNTQ